MLRIALKTITLQNIKHPKLFVEVSFRHLGNDNYYVWLDERTRKFFESTEWRVFDSKGMVV